MLIKFHKKERGTIMTRFFSKFGKQAMHKKNILTSNSFISQVPDKFKTDYNQMITGAKEKLKNPSLQKAVKDTDQTQVIKLLEELEEHEKHFGPY